ncbi:MAG: FAD-dependent oxidoreductase, partial [Erythrobacter sp.]
MSAETNAFKCTPYWWEAAPVSPLPQMPLEKRVDVAIIGAGYAGLTAGLTLARAGRSVGVYDKQHPGEGASSRNGGITSGNIRLDHATLVRKFGQERADAIILEGKDARQHLYDMIAAEGFDCDFAQVGRFGGALGIDDYERMARQAEHLERKLGIESYAVPQSEQHKYIGTDFFRGGSVRMDIGGLHPAKFIAELLRATQAAGVAVHSDTAVEGITKDSTGF